MMEEFTIIYRVIPYYAGSNHYGSRLAFDQNGNLIVSTGDPGMAQDLHNGLGKVTRMTIGGEAAAGNPFATDGDALPEIYSFGHRNVQGLAVHSVTGEIWVSEMGPQGGDELNLIKAGGNYGWPTISYGEEYSGTPIEEGLAQMDGMEQPRYYWDPVVAPAGRVFYKGGLIPEWENDLFIASLKRSADCQAGSGWRQCGEGGKTVGGRRGTIPGSHPGTRWSSSCSNRQWVALPGGAMTTRW